MREKQILESGLERALEGYARLVSDQNTETNAKITALATGVQQLVNISIQAEERHKQYDNRFERLEDNQKSTGIELKELTEHSLIMSHDLTRNAERWATLNKVLVSIVTSVLGAAIIAAYITTK